MFENSLQLVDECGLTFLHVFPYSAAAGHAGRAHAAGARSPDQGARGAPARGRGGGIARLVLPVEVGRRERDGPGREPRLRAHRACVVGVRLAAMRMLRRSRIAAAESPVAARAELRGMTGGEQPVRRRVFAPAVRAD